MGIFYTMIVVNTVFFGKLTKTCKTLLQGKFQVKDLNEKVVRTLKYSTKFSIIAYLKY